MPPELFSGKVRVAVSLLNVGAELLTIRVTVTVYVCIVVPSSAVTSTVITLEPAAKFTVPVRVHRAVQLDHSFGVGVQWGSRYRCLSQCGGHVCGVGIRATAEFLRKRDAVQRQTTQPGIGGGRVFAEHLYKRMSLVVTPFSAVHCEIDSGTVDGQIDLDAGRIRVSIGRDTRDFGMGVGGGGSDDDGSDVIGNADRIAFGAWARRTRDPSCRR